MAKLDVDTQSAAELNRLLDQALELPVPERLAWLDTHPEIPLALKGKLRELLLGAPGVETGDFLDTLPKLGRDGEPRNTPPPLAPGSVVGPYRLCRELGQGGMGSVWLAERVDGLVKRAVALKLPHVSWSRVGLAERMAREREILASLEHPHIARLYDAGLTTDGKPYLALEYVEGLPIDQYCAGDSQRPALDVRARLRLFVQVADAVTYAHGKLVLHRDLKPANVLVTPAGYVRLLDFGIAKLLGDGQPSKSKLTELSGRALTPDYASPEQILDEPLGVTSDVYSLGVVLYELLTGTRPYKLARDSRRALEDAIVQVDPPLASVAAPAADAGLLRGDLDTILAKALTKDPARRYQSVAAFAEDIERHLTHRPVVAQPDSAWYRARKFVRRNRSMVAAVAATSAAVVSGAGVALWQAQVALAQQQRSDAVKSLMVSMFENASVESSGGKSVSAVELLRQASATVVHTDIDDPLVSAEITRILARTFIQVHDLESAESAATNALSKAREQFAPNHIEVLRARLLLAEVHRRRGSERDLDAEYSALEAALVAQARAQPKDYLHLLNEQSHLANSRGRPEVAIATAERAIAFAREMFGDKSEAALQAHTLHGLALTFANRPAEAVAATRQAFDGFLAMYRGNALHPRVLSARAALAMSLMVDDQLPEAIAHMETALTDATKVFGADSIPVGYNSHNLSVMYTRAGRVQDAINAAARGLEIAKLHHGPESVNFAARQNILGRALLAAHRADEAVPLLEVVAAGTPKLFGPTHRNTLESRATYALALAHAKQIPRAVEVADEVLRDMESLGKPSTALPAIYRGQIARLAGEPAMAVRMTQGALRDGPPVRNKTQRAGFIVELGMAQLVAGDIEGAERSLLEGSQTLESTGHQRTPVWAAARLALSRVAALRRERGAALERAQAAASFWQEFDPDHAQAIEANDWLRELQSRDGD